MAILSISEGLIIALFAIAAVLHGISGMGFPMISTASLNVWYSLPEAVVLTLLPTLSLNVVSVVQGRQIGRVLKRFMPLAIASCVGSLVGAKYLLTIPSVYLECLMGSVILLFVVQASGLLRWRLCLSANQHWQIGFGLAAGLIGGATNAMSPLVMMYLLSCSQSSKEITQAANLCYLVSKLTQLFVLYPHLMALPALIWYQIAVITVISLLGLFLGIYWRRYISWQMFKNIILVVLTLLALRAFYQASLTFMN